MAAVVANGLSVDARAYPSRRSQEAFNDTDHADRVVWSPFSKAAWRRVGGTAGGHVSGRESVRARVASCRLIRAI